MKYSRHQLEVFREVWHGKYNILVNAVAGSGKTSTIEAAIAGLKGISKKKVSFMAFNKHIAKELKGRLRSSVNVSTLHSYGFAMIRRALNGGVPKLDEFGTKQRKDIAQIIKKCGWSHDKKSNADYASFLYELFPLCKAYVADDADFVATVAQNHDFEGYEAHDFERIDYCLKELYRDFDPSVITYDDMIYLSAIGKTPIVPHDLVFVDEAQDLNRAQHLFVERLGGKLVAVGDESQTIYQFAGSMDSGLGMMADRFSMKSIDLPICYRCPKLVVDFASKLVPRIKPFQGNGDGVLDYGSWMDVRDGDFVLARGNAHLIQLAIKLIDAGMPAIVRGYDIGQKLIKIIKSSGKFVIADLMQFMEDREKMTFGRLRKAGLSTREIFQSHSYKMVVEQKNVIRAVGQWSYSVSDLVLKLRSVFSDNVEGVVLSSVHRSKGLEADRVFILLDDLMEDVNLPYVAYTRAKKELYFINDFEQDGMNWASSERLNAYVFA